MKITKNKNTRSKIIATVLAVVLLTFGLAYYITSKASNDNTGQNETDNQSSIDTVAPAPETLSDEDAKAKKEHVENYKNPEDAPSSQGPVSQAKVEFMPSQENTTVVVRTKLTSIGDGTCTITATNGQRQHTETVEVLYQPTYSTCKGFSIPSSKLGSGTWSIRLQATSVNNTSASSTAEFKVT